jgi:hypothetical protein
MAMINNSELKPHHLLSLTKHHWTKWNLSGICYLIFLSPDFFANVFSSELWTRSDSVIILFIK